MKKIKKTKPKISILGFLKLRQKLNEQSTLPLSKQFLKRYKKLNKQAYQLSKINKKNEG
jgi:hypothetical protein